MSDVFLDITIADRTKKYRDDDGDVWECRDSVWGYYDKGLWTASYTLHTECGPFVEIPE